VAAPFLKIAIDASARLKAIGMFGDAGARAETAPEAAPAAGDDRGAAPLLDETEPAPSSPT